MAGALRVFTPHCACGTAAVGRLTYVRVEDGSEEGQSRWKCGPHLDQALDLWDQMRAQSPDAVKGLKVLVVS